ncbi:Aliphatic amidase expression-regulating protein [Variovorax sp. PBL-H6]|uniref:substrate-binding protein n=1 Tax=Variovorax sp. PBL-H6 TaxID=434009 RepID=UPI0013167DC5|nr:substrate-binding protein [Variovorax sp. PBL-H6]VTU26671.1 Aliphatic amidase expression-regulating protein [Variovorax sp. PBL-H6]
MKLSSRPVQAVSTPIHDPARRRLIAGSLASVSMAGFPFIARAADPIKLGILLPYSGGLELFGQQGEQGVRMAVEECNATGGVLGRQVEIVKADDKTDPKTAVERAGQLIRRDKVAAIVGPVTSANRDAIKSTIERGKTPLLYATDYEGGVCSPYMACYSALPAHYVNPLIPYLGKKVGKGAGFYLFGADYVWPQKMNAAIKAAVQQDGGKIVGEEYTPFGTKDFAPTLRKIADSGAKVLVLTLPGADGVTFVKQFVAAGLKDKVQVAFMGFNENYLPGFSNTESDGIITCSHFISTLDRPEAKEFVARQRKRFGDNATVSFYVDSHYGITRFFLDAMKKAGSTKPDDAMKAMAGSKLTVGNGEVVLREQDRHVDLNMLISEARGGQLRMLEYVGKIVAPNQCSKQG